MVAAAVAGGSALAGLASGAMAADAAGDASDAQVSAANAGIAEQGRQFDQIQSLLSPFVSAGASALNQQVNLAGLGGGSAQQAAIDAIKASPAYTSALQAGENSLLQNASASGGLRGGNLQSALAKFSPALLSQAINDQYSRLGALTSLGQNSAAGVGSAAASTSNGVTGLLQQIGASEAGSSLAQAKAYGGALSGISGGLGTYAALNNQSAQQAMLTALLSGGYYGGTYAPGADPLGNFITAKKF